MLQKTLQHIYSVTFGGSNAPAAPSTSAQPTSQLPNSSVPSISRHPARGSGPSSHPPVPSVTVTPQNAAPKQNGQVAVDGPVSNGATPVAPQVGVSG